MKIYKITDEEYNKQVAEQKVRIESYLRKAIDKFFPEESKFFEVHEDNTMTCFGIVIVPSKMEKKRIGGMKEVTSWFISETKYTPATYEQPEEYEDVEVGNFVFRDAINTFINLIFKRKLSIFWENIEIDELESSLDEFVP